MDWMEGKHLSEFAVSNTDREAANKVGQTLWDFYMYQMHHLKAVHADPHPGNFLVSAANDLIAIDFGCIKRIPDSFYIPYFELAQRHHLDNPEFFKEKMYELEILRKDDSIEDTTFFTALFYEMLSLFTAPFNEEEFDFSDKDFWNKISQLSEKYSKDTNLRKMNGNRGSKHFLYMNRTFFGLYNLLHDLKAKVHVNRYQQYL